MTLELRSLRLEDETSFCRAVNALCSEEPPWPFAFEFNPDGDFRAYVTRLEHWAQGRELPDRFVPNTFLVGVIDGAIVGRVSIRHELNPFLSTIGGHIGYGVVPAQRGRGFATEMLRQSLPICARLGIPHVLVTCDVDNVASRRVIEKCGGVFEGVTNAPELSIQKRRYWISTRPCN